MVRKIVVDLVRGPDTACDALAVEENVFIRWRAREIGLGQSVCARACPVERSRRACRIGSVALDHALAVAVINVSVAGRVLQPVLRIIDQARAWRGASHIASSVVAKSVELVLVGGGSRVQQ